MKPVVGFVLAVLAVAAPPAAGADPALENRVGILEQTVRGLTLGAPPAAVRDDAATRRRLDGLALEIRRLRAEVQALRERLDAMAAK